LNSPVWRLFESSYTKKPQSTQKNINFVISASYVVDYPYYILFLLISPKMCSIIWQYLQFLEKSRSKNLIF